MPIEPEVKIVADNGILSQFGRGPFYRRKPDFSSKKVALIFITVLVLASVPVVLSSPPEQEKEVKSNLGFNGDITQGETLQFPEHDATIENNRAHSKNKSSGSKQVAEKLRGPQLLNRPNNFKVPPGTFAKAVLLSGASNGPVRAQLTEPVSLNGETLIEEGSILLGIGQSTEERLFIHFTKIVLKDGSSETIDAQACDFEDKIAGLTGSKVGHYALRLGAGVGLNFVTGMSQGLQESEVQNGVAVRKADAKNALYNGMATAAAEQAQDLMSTTKNKQPIIEVKSGTPIYVILSQEGN